MSQIKIRRLNFFLKVRIIAEMSQKQLPIIRKVLEFFSSQARIASESKNSEIFKLNQRNKSTNSCGKSERRRRRSNRSIGVGGAIKKRRSAVMEKERKKSSQDSSAPGSERVPRRRLVHCPGRCFLRFFFLNFCYSFGVFPPGRIVVQPFSELKGKNRITFRVRS